MISLFGKEEFDPPGTAMRDPRTALKLSAFWVLVSLGWLALSVERVSHLRSSGRLIGTGREMAMCSWIVILLFWLWNGWINLRKYRADQR